MLYRIAIQVLLFEGGTIMYPVFYENVYGDKDVGSEFTKQDAMLNTIMLRFVAQELFSDETSACEEGGKPSYRWRVRITDQHDIGEDAPHYVLDFGNVQENEKPDLQVTGVKAYRYCDNHSVGNNRIEQALGTVTVTVWMDAGEPERSVADMSEAIAAHYCYDAMPCCFPDYYIQIFAPLY